MGQQHDSWDAAAAAAHIRRRRVRELVFLLPPSLPSLSRYIRDHRCFLECTMSAPWMFECTMEWSTIDVYLSEYVCVNAFFMYVFVYVCVSMHLGN